MRARLRPSEPSAQVTSPTFSIDALAATSALDAAELSRWLTRAGIARENGSPHTYELTDYGAQLVREISALQHWISQ